MLEMTTVKRWWVALAVGNAGEMESWQAEPPLHTAETVRLP